MAAIILNDADPKHRRYLKSLLQQQGHRVWLADHLSVVNAVLKDVPINLVILDLDKESFDDLLDFADRWRGVKILFLGTGSPVTNDFRTWIADGYISKSEKAGRFSKTVKQLLHQ